MSKELVISAASHERRVAILEEGQLVEIYIEREKEFALVGHGLYLKALAENGRSPGNDLVIDAPGLDRKRARRIVRGQA